MAPIASYLPEIEPGSIVTIVLAYLGAQLVVGSLIAVVFLCSCGKKREEDAMPFQYGPGKTNPQGASMQAYDMPEAPVEPEPQTAHEPNSLKSMWSSRAPEVQGAPEFRLMSQMENAEQVRPVGTLGSNPQNVPSLALEGDIKHYESPSYLQRQQSVTGIEDLTPAEIEKRKKQKKLEAEKEEADRKRALQEQLADKLQAEKQKTLQQVEKNRVVQDQLAVKQEAERKRVERELAAKQQAERDRIRKELTEQENADKKRRDQEEAERKRRAEEEAARKRHAEMKRREQVEAEQRRADEEEAAKKREIKRRLAEKEEADKRRALQRQPVEEREDEVCRIPKRPVEQQSETVRPTPKKRAEEEAFEMRVIQTPSSNNNKSKMIRKPALKVIRPSRSDQSSMTVEVPAVRSKSVMLGY